MSDQEEFWKYLRVALEQAKGADTADTAETKDSEAQSASNAPMKANILDFERGVINFDVRYGGLHTKNVEIEVAQAQRQVVPLFNNSHREPIRSHQMYEDLQSDFAATARELENDLQRNYVRDAERARVRHEVLSDGEYSKQVLRELRTEFSDLPLRDTSMHAVNCYTTNYDFDVLTGEYRACRNSLIEPAYKDYSFDTNVKGTQKIRTKLYRQSVTSQKTDDNLTNIDEELAKIGAQMNQSFAYNDSQNDKSVQEMLQENITIVKILSLGSNQWNNVQGLREYDGASQQLQQEEEEEEFKEQEIGNVENYSQLFNFIYREAKRSNEVSTSNRTQTTVTKIAQENNVGQQRTTLRKQLQQAQDSRQFIDFLEKMQLREGEEGEDAAKTDMEAEQKRLQDKIQREIKEREQTERLLAGTVKSKFVEIRLVDIMGGKLGTRQTHAYALEDYQNVADFYSKVPRSHFALEFDFELDDFQKRSVLHLEKGESILVCAHTSAGKTVIAEYAMALAANHKRRVVYTSPIKALSNEKYRKFVKRFNGDVGIITGDVTINPSASCLIMTTEILRNMLYKGNDVIRDIEWVIFDEVHYVNNPERGVVWEESIIMLPEQIGIIMLSATVPNYMDFANWVGRTKNRTIYVIKTLYRPVPLEHSIYIFNKFHIIKEKDGPFLMSEYEELKNQIEGITEERRDLLAEGRKKKAEKQEADRWKDKTARGAKKVEHMLKGASDKFIKKVTKEQVMDARFRDETRNVAELIHHCQKEELLPCVFFIFSKKKIIELAQGLYNLQLTDRLEESRIIRYFDKSVQKLKPQDQNLPQLLVLRDLLRRGIATHHGDLLPIAKEIVEILFSEGLVKVLFATETFAMGINMPTKTVVFFSLRKNDGKEFRMLNSSEYTQMAGRAGRRGLDAKGNVVIYMQDPNHLPSKQDMAKIVDHKGEQLQSKYRVTYAVMLNKLNAPEFDVMDMMRSSFSENDRLTQKPRNLEKIKDLRQKYKLLSEIECPYQPKTLAAQAPIEEYYQDFLAVQDSNERSISLEFPLQVLQKIDWPKYALVIGANSAFELVVIVDTLPGNAFQILLVKEVGQEQQQQQQQKNSKKKIILRYEQESRSKTETFNIKGTNAFYTLSEARQEEVAEIFSEKLSVRVSDRSHKAMEDLAKLLILKRESFNEQNFYGVGEGGSNNAQAAQQSGGKKRGGSNQQQAQLQRYNTGIAQNLQVSVAEQRSVKEEAVQHLFSSRCYDCVFFAQHFDQIDRRSVVQGDLEKLVSEVDENELKYIDNFEGRVKVLKRLQYIDEANQPMIKARIAKELGESEIFIAELIVDNVLADLRPAEVAALISAFVCQYKSRRESEQMHLLDIVEDEQDQIWQDDFVHAAHATYTICEKIVRIEIEEGVVPGTRGEEHQYIRDNVLNFTLAKVVYLWTHGKDFKEILEISGAQEGVIVRTILRLENSLKNIKNAAKIVGNTPLMHKVEFCQNAIKRDIVFTQSLYLEED